MMIMTLVSSETTGDCLSFRVCLRMALPMFQFGACLKYKENGTLENVQKLVSDDDLALSRGQ